MGNGLVVRPILVMKNTSGRRARMGNGLEVRPILVMKNTSR
jgi:hypothetical protein